MSKILQVENLVQEFNLTKDFLDKVKFKNGHFSLENRVVHAVNNVKYLLSHLQRNGTPRKQMLSAQEFRCLSEDDRGSKVNQLVRHIADNVV